MSSTRKLLYTLRTTIASDLIQNVDDRWAYEMLIISLTGMSSFDQACEPYWTDTGITPGYKK